jgi:hypothetical protein
MLKKTYVRDLVHHVFNINYYYVPVSYRPLCLVVVTKSYILHCMTEYTMQSCSGCYVNIYDTELSTWASYALSLRGATVEPLYMSHFNG